MTYRDRPHVSKSFHPVLYISDDYEVLDLSQGEWATTDTPPSSSAVVTHAYSSSETPSESPSHVDRGEKSKVGRFNEVRRGLYKQALFSGGDAPRCVHMGIDIGGRPGAEVMSFDAGVIYALGELPSAGDYGHAVVIEYIWREDEPLTCGQYLIASGDTYWALYGHLSASSLHIYAVGDRVKRGQLIGWLGAESENGGWPPHLHFQLSRERPDGHDMPGVVTVAERDQALDIYPDPRAILGALY